MSKPNCYECKYRGSAIGSAHSTCRYPGTKTGMFDLIAPENIKLFDQLQIRGARHGIENGWFFWPANFDPVWLENCNGFEAKAAQPMA